MCHESSNFTDLQVKIYSARPLLFVEAKFYVFFFFFFLFPEFKVEKKVYKRMGDALISISNFHIMDLNPWASSTDTNTYVTFCDLWLSYQNK